LVDVESVEAYLEGNDQTAVALFRRFESLVESCGPSQVAPRRTIVYWKRERVFAGAFSKSRRLELVIDLLRAALHPLLVAEPFHTTKHVVTHRLRVVEAARLDDSVRALVQEAYRDVGPGTRGR
jgi:Domain of unknown function (DUF5655)